MSWSSHRTRFNWWLAYSYKGNSAVPFSWRDRRTPRFKSWRKSAKFEFRLRRQASRYPSERPSGYNVNNSLLPP